MMLPGLRSRWTMLVPYLIWLAGTGAKKRHSDESPTIQLRSVKVAMIIGALASGKSVYLLGVSN